MYRPCALLLLLAASAAAQGGAVCPDGTRCSDGSCCMTIRPDQPYGCCPFLNGVCCADMLHCCPQNYHCDLDRGMCLPGPASALFGRRAGGGGRPAPLAPPAAPAPAPNQCPDGKTSCSPTATCCQMKGGGYACCPEVRAVCCPDQIHCCPEGTKCDVKDRTCIKVKKHPMLTLV